jgi:hypothetical protein
MVPNIDASNCLFIEGPVFDFVLDYADPRINERTYVFRHTYRRYQLLDQEHEHGFND